MKKLETIAKRYFKASDVVYITSDGVAFYSEDFAKSHAQKNGLEVKRFKKPTKKRVNNGTK